MEKQITCPRCKGQMEIGYSPDAAYAAHSVIHCWLPGAPEPAMRQELKGAHPIVTYRCKDCGVLESYAHPPKPA